MLANKFHVDYEDERQDLERVIHGSRINTSLDGDVVGVCSENGLRLLQRRVATNSM